MCKSCISEFEYCRQLKEELSPLIENYAKVMSILSKFGDLINKDKNDEIKN